MPRSRPAPMIVGNWKMHGVTADLAEIGAIARELLERPAQLLRLPGVDRLVVGRAAPRAAQFLPVARAACQTTAPPLGRLPTD